MAGLGNAPSDDFYNAITGKGNWTQTNMFAAPCTTAPSDDDGGGLVEAAVFSPDNRLEMTNGNWAAASGGLAAYNALLDWGATSGPATIQGIAFFDLNAAGVFQGYEPLAAPAVLSTGNNFQIDSGNLTLDFNANGGTGTLGDLGADQAADAWTGKTLWTAADMFFALMITAPGNFDTGTGGTEVTLGNYVRVAVPNAGWAPPAGDGAGLLTADVVWPEASGANWGLVAGIAIANHISTALGATTYFGYTALAASQQINIGGVFTLDLNTLTLNCNLN